MCPSRSIGGHIGTGLHADIVTPISTDTAGGGHMVDITTTSLTTPQMLVPQKRALIGAILLWDCHHYRSNTRLAIGKLFLMLEETNTFSLLFKI
uniref:Uncharacterized protein n=1 Tax=Ditylenchus dipsaci TaxID=166011 RepID=A0A915ECS9_9BILA